MSIGKFFLRHRQNLRINLFLFAVHQERAREAVARAAGYNQGSNHSGRVYRGCGRCNFHGFGRHWLARTVSCASRAYLFSPEDAEVSPCQAQLFECPAQLRLEDDRDGDEVHRQHVVDQPGEGA